MKAKLDLEINVQEIIELRETHWDFSFANDLAPDDLVRAFELSTEEIDFKEVDRFGDLNSFFGLNIEFNPHLWALVWGGGYNVQFNLYADTYDEKCVNVFASLGLVVLLCRCERNHRTLQAAKLILKARDKALLLLRTQPKKAEPRPREELLRLELESLAAQMASQQEAAKKDYEKLKLEQATRRTQLLESLADSDKEELERLKEAIQERQEVLEERLRVLENTNPLEIQSSELAYTKEQRKANKARASAIRLKARTMSFVDKRSIR